MSYERKFTIYCPDRKECSGLFDSDTYAQGVIDASRAECANAHEVLPVHVHGPDVKVRDVISHLYGSDIADDLQHALDIERPIR